MPTQDFIGREAEIGQIRALWGRRKGAALVTCFGRRRIGKSRLIQEVARRHADHFLEFQGLAPRAGQRNEDQLRQFGRRYEDRDKRQVR